MFETKQWCSLMLNAKAKPKINSASFDCVVQRLLSGGFRGGRIEWHPEKVVRNEGNGITIWSRDPIANPRSNAKTKWTENVLKAIAAKRSKNWISILAWAYSVMFTKRIETDRIVCLKYFLFVNSTIIVEVRSWLNAATVTPSCLWRRSSAKGQNGR